jgi:Fe-S-cluster-containing hydrogenase component 2
MEKASPSRRAFLAGEFFTRDGRAALAARHAGQDEPSFGAVALDGAACLAWQRITCVSCKNACPENAIAMAVNQGPRIDPQLCSDCGQCAAVCPAGAIRIAILGRQ